MTTKEIEKQMEAISDHLNRADQGKYATGNLIIAMSKLMEINRGMLARIEHLEDVLQGEQERPRRTLYRS